MPTLLNVREQIADLTAQATAIQELATSENREFTPEETTELDAILGTGDAPGKIANLRREEDRLAKIEAIKAKNLGKLPPANAEPTPGTVIVPANSHRPRTLKAFRGESRAVTEQKAYSFGRWFKAMLGDETSRQWCRDHGYELKNAMTEGFDAKGGLLVPVEFENAIIDLRNEYGVARRECKVVPMSSDTKRQPRRAGGLTAYAVGEAATITASDKTWDYVELIARKWAVLTRYSAELNEDAIISIGDDLVSEIAYAFANKEDECLFNGDGTSTYHGIVGLKNALLAGSKYTAATGNTSFATLDLEDFEGMVAKAASYAFRGMPKWYIHRSGWATSMLRLAAAAGGNTRTDIEGGYSQQFLGYDVVFVEVMNSTLSAQTSTTGLCYFGNLPMAAMLGDRRGMAISNSDQVYFTSDELAIKGTERFDINVHDKGTASVAGAMVVLATPGS
jgi:HK97 family phage major capsid protein